MLSDIQIASAAKMLPITEIAKQLDIDADDIECYGKYKAKLSESLYKKLAGKKDGKLVLVTAVNPTPAGEGKTTTTVGLGQGMAKIGKKAVIALREPSLGPVFGVKGGAAGGGYSQVVPMEDINLHFTGDLHAVTAANNLLCAAIDNHIHQGNALRIDPCRVLFSRVMDMNDRALRKIVVGLGGKTNGMPREDGFMISVASEVMAILCLSESISDMKERFGNILVAYNMDGEPVWCRDLKVNGAMTALMKDAIKPNLVQTLENTPCLIHGGPFANIAHGCNSVRATKLALKMADYTITEAGFGADLGAEKFFDIKCRKAGLKPDAVVLVATVRALKYNGGVEKAMLAEENLQALEKGACNLEAHIENLSKFGLPTVVALNRFGTDTEAEIDFIRKVCEAKNADFVVCDAFAKGGDGAKELATAVCAACEKPSQFKYLYDENDSIENKLKTLAMDYYGAKTINLSAEAKKSMVQIEELGLDRLPVCIAKTQYSMSDNAKLLGRPNGFEFTIRQMRVSAGAGFIVALAGDIMTMPGLPKAPAAQIIDIDDDFNISGLF